MRGILLIAALGTGGCNLVFGLDEPEDGAADAGIDGPRGFAEPVTLQIAGTVDLAVPRPSGGRPAQAVVLAVQDSAVVLVTADPAREPSATFITLESAPVSVAALDLNGDGISDLAAVTSDGIELRLGLADGTLIPASSIVDPGGSVIAAGPYVAPDGDDLVLAHAALLGVSEWQGNGVGVFTPGTPFSSDAVPDAIESADLDRDGIDELLISDSAGVRVYRHTSTGFVVFGTGQPAPATAMLVTRFDENDLLDLLIGAADGTLAVWLGDGDGGFVRDLTLQTEAVGAMALARGDADSDGRNDDVAVAAPAASTVHIFLTEGGALAEVHRFPFADAPTAVAFADLDGDGLDDLVVVLASEVMIFFGQ